MLQWRARNWRIERLMRRVCCSFAFAAVCAACSSEDPPVWEDGPSFLIVGKAAKQGAPGNTRLYVQARGGDYVGIVTHGGVHALSALPTPASTSCAALHGSEPLYLDVHADDPNCVVEVRLYSICDGASMAGEVVPLQICETEGTFVTTRTVPVRGAVMPRDGGADD